MTSDNNNWPRRPKRRWRRKSVARSRARSLRCNAFTLAEDYHQKYILKQDYDLNAEMSRIYPLHRDFVDSTAVARLNGYASGHGDKDQLAREIDRLGLTDAGKRALTDMAEAEVEV